MTVKISHTNDVQQFFKEASGFSNDAGSSRLKTVINRVLTDTARIIEDLEITQDEFWKAVDYINVSAVATKPACWSPDSTEHYLDLLQDAKDEQEGLVGGTPRTIEGPLYVAGAPIAQGIARMDDGSEDDVATVMFLQGRVLDPTGEPLAGAVVDLWHANTKGNYSYFDKSQSEYNLRRRIVTDERLLPRAQHRAVRLWLLARRADPGGARHARSSRPAAGAHSFLHLRAWPSSPDHADQPGWRQIPLGRLRLRHARWSGRRHPLHRRCRSRTSTGRAGAFCRSGFRLPAAEGAGPASRAAQQAATGAAAGLTVPAVSGLLAPQRRCTGNAAASFITRVIRASATDRQAYLARRHESSDERLSLSAVVAGFIATVISYAGPLVIIFQAAKAANLPHDVLSSWVWTISIGSGVLGILLSVRYRVPIIIAWSAPGSALLVTMLPDITLNEAVGAYIVSSVVVLLVGLSGAFDRIINRLPAAIAAGMLAGILFRFGTGLFVSVRNNPGWCWRCSAPICCSSVPCPLRRARRAGGRCDDHHRLR